MKTKTFELKQSGYEESGYEDWEPSSGDYGVCQSSLAELIDIPAKATTIWVTLTKRRKNANSLRLTRDTRGSEALLLRVDGGKSFGAYPFVRGSLEAFGLPCWATVEWG